MIEFPFSQGIPAMVYFDDWIAGPDGREYRSAWGPVSWVEAKDALGFVPKGDNNWFVMVGVGDGALLVAGCRIHYLFVSHRMPENAARCYVPLGSDEAA